MSFKRTRAELNRLSGSVFGMIGNGPVNGSLLHIIFKFVFESLANLLDDALGNYIEDEDKTVPLVFDIDSIINWDLATDGPLNLQIAESGHATDKFIRKIINVTGDGATSLASDITIKGDALNNALVNVIYLEYNGFTTITANAPGRVTAWNTTKALPDNTAPVFSTAVVEDADKDVLVVEYSKIVTSTIAGLSLEFSSGTPKTITSVLSGSGTDTVTYQLSAEIEPDDVFTLEAAEENGVKDSSFNYLPESNIAVTNNVAASFDWTTDPLSGLYLNFADIDSGDPDQVEAPDKVIKHYDISPDGRLFQQTNSALRPILVVDGVEYNGTSQYLLGPNFSNYATFASTFTFGVNFKLPSIPAANSAVLGTNRLTIRILPTSGKLDIWLFPGSTAKRWTSANSVADNTLKRLIIEVNDATKTISVWDAEGNVIANDGVNTGDFTGISLSEYAGQTLPLALGARNNAGAIDQYFGGTIGKVLIYKGATDASIRTDIIGAELTA